MTIKRKLKTAGIGLALSIASSFVKSGNTIYAHNQNAKENKIEITTPDKTNDDIAMYFSPEELAAAIQKAGLSKETAEKFIKSYTKKTDKKLRITSENLINAYKEAGLSLDQAKTITQNLLGKNTYDLTKQETIEQQNLLNNKGYDYGSYNISFAINQNGNISSLHMNRDTPYDTNELKKINEAICRHTGKAVDRMKWRMEASSFITQMLVYKIIKEKENKGENVPNGEKFIKRFHQNLQKNGLQISEEGTLEGIDASKNKPLKTEDELKKEYIQKRNLEFNAFKQRQQLR